VHFVPPLHSAKPFAAKDAKDAKEAGILDFQSLCDLCVRCGQVSFG
jgi:hypothetical protein